MPEDTDTRSGQSIRQNVALPILRDLGFATMDQQKCSGRCFDPTGSFSKRTEEENLKTFNGLHIPNDKRELDVTFPALLTIIKPWINL